MGLQSWTQLSHFHTLGLPELVSKNIGCLLKFEFQMKNKFLFFSKIMSPKYWGHTYTKIFMVYQNPDITKSPLFYVVILFGDPNFCG